MAQLSDDCFAFGGELMPVDGVVRLIETRITPVSGSEILPVAQARGRVLAHDVAAPVSLPPFDNSAVDGYAVRFCDLSGGLETVLTVSGHLLAGAGQLAAIEPGTAVRIFTGAPMPEGADTVFMQEDVRVTADGVALPPGLKQGANRRLMSEDVKAGSVVIPAGTRLGVQHLAMASAVGMTQVHVRRRLRMALFSTGNEIVEPGRPLPPAGTYDANRSLLRAQAEALGVEVTDLGILSDDVETLSAALRQAAADHDLVLTSGGVSTGEADYVRTAVERIGSLTFWRTAIKPGRPVAMGVLKSAGGETAAFCGLPGNPVAAFVTFAMIVRPLLLQLSGAKSEPLMAFPVRANFSYKKKAGRREFVRVSLSRASDGALEAAKYKQDGAGVISSLTQTDGLVQLPEDCIGVVPGDSVGFISYAALIGG
jgi:molybdopterin molybdotransferase